MVDLKQYRERVAAKICCPNGCQNIDDPYAVCHRDDWLHEADAALAEIEAVLAPVIEE